jgi:hypothetical protein
MWAYWLYVNLLIICEPIKIYNYLLKIYNYLLKIYNYLFYKIAEGMEIEPIIVLFS